MTTVYQEALALSVPPAADYKRMLAHLRQPGASLSIQPEGIAGIFLSSDTATESIFLSKRKGFVKLAIQGGAGRAPSLPSTRRSGDDPHALSYMKCALCSACTCIASAL